MKLICRFCDYAQIIQQNPAQNISSSYQEHNCVYKCFKPINKYMEMGCKGLKFEIMQLATFPFFIYAIYACWHLIITLRYKALVISIKFATSPATTESLRNLKF